MSVYAATQADVRTDRHKDQAIALRSLLVNIHTECLHRYRCIQLDSTSLDNLHPFVMCILRHKKRAQYDPIQDTLLSLPRIEGQSVRSLTD